MRLILALLVSLAVGSIGFAADIKPPKFEPKVLEVFARADGVPDWNVVLLNVPEAWKKTRGKGSIVVVADTGIDKAHKELAGSVIAEQDFTNSATGPRDVQGHGTHCAGSVRANKQVDGVAKECSLINYKVLSDNGSGDFAFMEKALRAAIKRGDVNVFSASLGSGPSREDPRQFMPSFRRALEDAASAGIIVVVAAGNDGPGAETVGYPGRYGEVVPHMVVVAACDRDRQITSFSSRGNAVFVTAPGKGITSSYPGDKYATWDGTSMATPQIAGTAALFCSWLKQTAPDVPKSEYPERFISALREGASFPNARHPARGFGLANAAKTLDKITASVPVPPTIPPAAEVTISFADLSAAKQAELRAAGITTFSVTVGAQAAPAPTMARADSYADCAAAVSAGRSVLLSVGSDEAAEFYTPALNGFVRGVYRCWKANGKHWMDRVQTAPVQQQFAPVPVQVPQQQFAPIFPRCGPGGCPQPAFNGFGFRPIFTR